MKINLGNVMALLENRHASEDSNRLFEQRIESERERKNIHGIESMGWVKPCELKDKLRLR